MPSEYHTPQSQPRTPVFDTVSPSARQAAAEMEELRPQVTPLPVVAEHEDEERAPTQDRVTLRERPPLPIRRRTAPVPRLPPRKHRSSGSYFDENPTPSGSLSDPETPRSFRRIGSFSGIGESSSSNSPTVHEGPTKSHFAGSGESSMDVEELPSVTTERFFDPASGQVTMSSGIPRHGKTPLPRRKLRRPFTSPDQTFFTDRKNRTLSPPNLSLEREVPDQSNPPEETYRSPGPRAPSPARSFRGKRPGPLNPVGQPFMSRTVGSHVDPCPPKSQAVERPVSIRGKRPGPLTPTDRPHLTRTRDSHVPVARRYEEPKKRIITPHMLRTRLAAKTREKSSSDDSDYEPF